MYATALSSPTPCSETAIRSWLARHTHFENMQFCKSDRPHTLSVHSKIQYLTSATFYRKGPHFTYEINTVPLKILQYTAIHGFPNTSCTTFQNLSIIIKKPFRKNIPSCAKNHREPSKVITEVRLSATPVRVVILILISCMLENERSNMVFFPRRSDHCRGD